MFLGNLTETLELFTVAEVAAVAEAWNDVLMLVHALVDGSTPDGRALGQCLLDDFDALGGGNDAAEVNLLGLAGLQQRLDGGREAATCCQHGVDNEQRLVLDALRGDVLGMDKPPLTSFGSAHSP